VSFPLNSFFIHCFCQYFQTEKPFHSNPWQILLRINPSSICGGTLIAGNLVLTAAHCFQNESFKGTTVVAGASSW
jgi:hypothetical protein